MKCPSCSDITLLISSRENIEIDYCPQCRGVWLDRGELDKIIERSDNQRTDTSTMRPTPTEYRRDDRDRDDDWDDDTHHAAPAGRKRKRRSFLSDMFEFGE